jgi:signal transduction histidine kinase
VANSPNLSELPDTVLTRPETEQIAAQEALAPALPSLRQVLLRRVVLVLVVQIILSFAVAKFQLYPQVEALQITLNSALADNIAQSAKGSLSRPMLATQAALKQLSKSQSGKFEQMVLQQLVDSTEAAESAYLLNDDGLVTAVAYAPSTNSMSKAVDSLGLDLSQSEVFRSADKTQVSLSQLFLSAVSERRMVAITAPLVQGGILVLEMSLNRLAQDENVTSASSGVQVLIVDDRGQIIADQDGVKSQKNGMLPIDALQQLALGGAATITVDERRWFASSVRLELAKLDWRVIVMRPEALVVEPIIKIVIVTTVTTALLLVLAFFIFMLVTRKITRATEALSEHARQLEAGHAPLPRDFHVQELFDLDTSLRSMAQTLSQREASLLHANQVLEARVAERTLHLQQSNTELARAMQQIQGAQAELIQSGKMAALGSMVAGVAHELNTPVGNARLVATSILERAKSLIAMLSSTQISRKQITQCAMDFQEGASIIDKNLERASDLVNSFKQVAVDQTSNRRRSFFLDETVHENQLLLSLRLSRANVTIELETPAKLEMHSYPGDIGQVLTNLIENAVVHAYAGLPGGRISITLERLSPSILRIELRDYGRGIPEEALPRIFDPFFTSRLGHGGSGLGLSIVYGLVTQSLGGKISVSSSVNEGSCFILELPVNAPESCTASENSANLAGALQRP